MVILKCQKSGIKMPQLLGQKLAIIPRYPAISSVKNTAYNTSRLLKGQGDIN